MLILPKWLNRYLTPEEEARIADPSRRVFSFGLLASAALLAVPALPLPKEVVAATGTLQVFRINTGLWVVEASYCVADEAYLFEGPKLQRVEGRLQLQCAGGLDLSSGSTNQ